MALAVWQGTIVDESGNVQSEASVEVLVESSGATAALFSDRDGTVPIVPPLTADDDGFVRFYAAGGAYRINATLGAFTRTWRHVSLGLLGERDTVTDSIIVYNRTPAEIAAGVTPVSYRYPEGHGRRYGMVGDGVTDDTAACETWLSFCYGRDVAAVIDGGIFLLADATVTCSGGRVNAGFKITGSGKNVTRFKPFGTPSWVLKIEGSTPGSGTPNSNQMMMRDISFWGVAQSCDGLILDGIASFHFDNVQIDGFQVGLDLKSSLIGSAVRSIFSANNIGLRTRRNGTSAYCNLLTFRDCLLTSNSQFGADLGDANGIKFDACDIEANGVSCPTSTVTIAGSAVAWTAHGLSANDPLIFTTTGTLPVELTPNVIYYAVILSANSLGVATVPFGSDITLTGSGSGTHTAISPNTGGVVIRESCIDELGYAIFEFANNWFEGNNGCAIRSEYMTSSFGLQLAVRGGHILGTGNSYSFAIAEARHVSIEDHHCVAGTDIANISSDNLVLKNARFITLNRPLVNWTTVINSSFNGVDYPWGETGSSTLTLTGCTTSPTGVATWMIQGRDITVELPEITGTSNTTAATLTGLAARLAPSATRLVMAANFDNGNVVASYNQMQTSGNITLFAASAGVLGAFTASGTKGCSAVTLRYRK